jgi:DNA uptake protein ComE-like DNA-binding protein
MKRMTLLLLTAAVILAAVPVHAQVGKSLGVIDANTALEKDLLAVPLMNATLVKSIMDTRPFASVMELNKLLSASLNKEQLTQVYGKMFVHINLNTATSEEILLIPGSGPRVVREFQEYRPYSALAVFHREMRKYWDEAEVSRLEQYVFVPINLNTATDAEILSIPGSGNRVLREFKEYRPYTSMAQFEREMRKYWDAKEVARLQRYVSLVEAGFKNLPERAVPQK